MVEALSKISVRVLTVLLVFALTSVASHAIIVRHDIQSTNYEIRNIDYPAVFFLERQGSRKICVATVIHQRWALTAAHCTEQTMVGETVSADRRFGVMVGGKPREIDLVIKHPLYDQTSATDVDLALLRFREPSSTPRPVNLQTEPTEMDAIVTLLGWGYLVWEHWEGSMMMVECVWQTIESQWPKDISASCLMIQECRILRVCPWRVCPV